MGRTGPRMEENLVREGGVVWPVGAIKRYEEPKYRVKGKEYLKYEEAKEEKEEVYRVDKVDKKLKKYGIEPNIISYRNFKANQWAMNQNACYRIEHCQYLVFNPDQLQIRYVIQFRKLNN